MLTYLPDDSDRCRVKELMASVRPSVQLKTREPKESAQSRPPRMDFGSPLVSRKSMR